jgi:hypothetical protein
VIWLKRAKISFHVSLVERKISLQWSSHNPENQIFLPTQVLNSPRKLHAIDVALHVDFTQCLGWLLFPELC